MMRLLGSVLVLGATLWFGAYFAAKEKYRLQELAELERAILLLQSQIAYLSAPLTEILESIGWKAEARFSRRRRQSWQRGKGVLRRKSGQRHGRSGGIRFS